MPGPHTPSTGRTLLFLALFVAIGAPAAFFLWEQLSTLFYGRVSQVHPLWLVAAAVVLVVLLRALAGYARRLEM